MVDLLRDPGMLEQLSVLARWLQAGRVCVLTGAGISTESGIPDYRGPETRRRARNPIRMNEFLRDPQTRRRYWARSCVGWPRVARAEPNAGHQALAELEARELLSGVITQNVDGLHTRAGSANVVELHGALRWVVCLDCGKRHDRDELQRRLTDDNAGFSAEVLRLAPDGDADIAESLARSFRPPECDGCVAGVLKPDVVFFGENVPAPRVERAYAMLEGADALLVIGSSLAVYSGYRFVRRASERGVPVALINLGETRGDAHASIKLNVPAGAALRALTSRLPED